MSMSPQILMQLGFAALRNIRQGEALANDIASSKKSLDPDGTGKWWERHPDMPTLKAGLNSTYGG